MVARDYNSDKWNAFANGHNSQSVNLALTCSPVQLHDYRVQAQPQPYTHDYSSIPLSTAMAGCGVRRIDRWINTQNILLHLLSTQLYIKNTKCKAPNIVMVAMDYNLKKWSALQTTITLVSRNDNEYYGGGGGGGGGEGIDEWLHWLQPVASVGCNYSHISLSQWWFR